eukprot:m.127473 g.127473  ORF g.127473 m.127473 type:complete len:441 (+) comp15801_c0_seq5:1301-2623(+)
MFEAWVVRAAITAWKDLLLVSVTMASREAAEKKAREQLGALAEEYGLDVKGGAVRRTSSRFCLGVEHGDYNGTELFGVGTDRFIWMAYKPNNTNRVRIVSHNFLEDGLIDFELGKIPAPQSPETAATWARFAYGVNYILSKNGYAIEKGMDAVVYGNIPGGGMSRSASLTLNLLLNTMDVNGIPVGDETTPHMRIIDLAQAVEVEYIGSPCGQLDQIMIYFAKDGQGTHYKPAEKSITYVPLGEGCEDFAIVSLDTGTMRPGLEKSTYKVRRQECDELAAKAGAEFNFRQLGDIKDEALLQKVLNKYSLEMPDHCKRLEYIFHAQKRFYKMMEAWKEGNIRVVGEIFRQDGLGLRDVYQISGPELESMNDVARGVDGVLGERMLGGGDKGACGALVLADSVEALQKAVDHGYPASRPAYAKDYAMHVCRIVDGVVMQPGL